MLRKFFKPKTASTGRDTPDHQALVQRIGEQALEVAHGREGKVLLYAEVEDGVISADIFSQVKAGPVRLRFAPTPLKLLIEELWRADEPSGKRWATMAYLLEGARVEIAFEYPDALVRGEDLADRRPRILQAHFGAAPVDYSAPR